MGRELKRVPVDFSWPLNKIWQGYINPHSKPCPDEGKTCFHGHTAAGRWLDAMVRLIHLAGEEALVAEHGGEMMARGRIYPHPYLEEWPQAPRSEWPEEARDYVFAVPFGSERNTRMYEMQKKHPPKLLPLTQELAQLVQGLVGEDRKLPHCNANWNIEERLKQLAGVDEDWGICPTCGGEAQDPACKEAYEAWQDEEPPTGDGFQLWTTTNEGAPISPVFGTLDELCGWCEPNATTFGHHRATAAEWRKMLEAGMVCHQEGNMVFV